MNCRNTTHARMSTFFGLIEEIPGISVDRFDGQNLASSVFFLSHCHTDHMHGLSDSFFEHLVQYNKYLYCSRITKALLENKYKFRSSYVKDVDTNEPIVVEYKIESDDTILVSVTCVPAGHCPGSVMFLFERNDKSVLYTGDFRINPLDFPKLKSLHYCQDKRLLPRTFTNIYLDTTFLSTEFHSFPSRQESIVKISNVIEEWLRKDPRNVVVLECSALYGAEFLFIELSKALDMRIHVQDYVYESYCRIAELSGHVTNDPHSTPIHACKKKISASSLNCRQDISETNIITVIPSAMKWRNKDTSVVGEWDKARKQTFNVCYSMHSSFEELKAFVQYFKALKIHPCVVKKDDEKVVDCLLEEITKSDEKVTIKRTYRIELSRHRKLKKLPFKSEYFSDDSL